MIRFGDRVSTYIEGHGSPREDNQLVIGVPHYSMGYHEIVIVAGREGQCCPISAKWCTRSGATDLATAIKWREAAMKAWPGGIRAFEPAAMQESREDHSEAKS